MKIILAPDSFKESLTATQVCDAIARGIRRTMPEADIIALPIADGGEGTVPTLVAATNGRLEQCAVVGPLGDTIHAEFGILGDKKTAVIEMAAASGLQLVPAAKRNPLYTTTFGTGQLIHAALDTGARHIIIGIGGSATNDGGTGMAQALGVNFYHDSNLITTYMNGDCMAAVTRIDMSKLHARLLDITITVACDVDNPLLGEHGAAHTYAPQKGGTPKIVEQLEKNMAHIFDLIEPQTRSVRDMPGAGAAGGLGAGLVAFLNAHLASGIDTILDACRFSERIRDADLILTGEGKIDRQSAMGKTISGVLKRAGAQNVPVIAIGGSVENGAEALFERGLLSLFSICDRPMNLADAMQQAAPLIEKTTERIMRVFSAKH